MRRKAGRLFVDSYQRNLLLDLELLVIKTDKEDFLQTTRKTLSAPPGTDY